MILFSFLEVYVTEEGFKGWGGRRSSFVFSLLAPLLVKLLVRHTHGLNIRREIRKEEDKIRLILGIIWQEQRRPVLKGSSPAWNNSFCRLSPVAGRDFKAKLGYGIQFTRGKPPELFLARAQCCWSSLGPHRSKGEVSCGISRLQWLAANLVAVRCRDNKGPHPSWHPGMAGGKRTLKRPSYKAFQDCM